MCSVIDERCVRHDDCSLCMPLSYCQPDGFCSLEMERLNPETETHEPAKDINKFDPEDYKT